MERNRKRRRSDDFEIERSPSLDVPTLYTYTIGWICALDREMTAARAILDNVHDGPPELNDYMLGSIGAHNIAIACLPSGGYGTTWAAVTAAQMKSKFPSLKYYLMVGIGGGVPRVRSNIDIRLGDVVVSTPTGELPGVIQYDFGKTLPGGRFQRTGSLNKPPQPLLTAVNKLRAKHRLEGSQISSILSKASQRHPKARDMFQYLGEKQDQLFEADYVHTEGETCKRCDYNKLISRESRPTSNPMIHYGVIASGNQVVKDALRREMIAKDFGVYCFEMEAAGLMDICECLVIRGICDYSDSHKNKQWQDYAAVTAAAYAKELLITAVPTIEGTNSNSSSYNQKETEELFLQSLSFLEIDNRLENITLPLRNTCDWIFQTTEFQQWQTRKAFEEYNGVLWIKGKPGAGKSTLLKHIFRHCKGNFCKSFIGAYFFNARSANRLEMSFEGMLRSLLHQVLDADPQLRRKFTPKYEIKKKKHGLKEWAWTVGELRELFLEVITQSTEPIIIFVDALDECNEREVRTVVEYLEHLSTAALYVENDVRLNICLSSRHYPTITIRKHLELVLELQQHHDRDIAIYVEEKLKADIQSIQLDIRQRAEGVFMWVILVVEILNRAFDEGDITTTKQKLQEIPNELDEIFLMLLENDNSRKKETLLLLQWVLFAFKPLTPIELYYAVKAGITLNCEELAPHDESIVSDRTIRRYITSTSRGLVEIKIRKALSKGYTQFIHQTVNDFLLRNNRLQVLDDSLATNAVTLSHRALTRCCLSYTMMKDLPEYTKKHSLLSTEEKVPFLSYAALNFLDHAEEAQKGETDAKWFIKYLHGMPQSFEMLKASHDQLRPSRESEPYDKEGVSADLLYVTSLKGYQYLTQALLQDPSIDINAKSGYYGSAIQVAINNGILHDSTKMIQLLINSGANLNIVGANGRTPLQEAVILLQRTRHTSRVQNIMNLLLKSGADVNAATDLWGNILHTILVVSIARYWPVTHYNRFPYRLSMKSFQVVFNTGVDVNTPGGHFGNPLQAVAVAACADEDSTGCEIIKILLAAGADVNAQGGYYGNALQALAAHSIDYYPKENIRDGNNFGYVKFMQAFETLLKAGAEVNSQGGHYGNVLQAAVASSSYFIDFIRRDHFWGDIYNDTNSALGRAKRAKAFIRLLLNAGAKVNATGGFYRNPLQAAVICTALKDPFDAIRRLSVARADSRSRGGIANKSCLEILGQPLDYRSNPYRGYGLQIVDMLLEAGAVIDLEANLDCEKEFTSMEKRFPAKRFPGKGFYR